VRRPLRVERRLNGPSLHSQSLCGGVFSAADDTVRDPPSRKRTEARLTFEQIESGSGTETLRGALSSIAGSCSGWTVGVATHEPPTRRDG
jgi:hypothetical protein